MQTALECQKISGDYHSNLLCTAPQLETICQKTQRTICDEETGRIFYLDSCGNKANIYDSVNYDNNDYWTKVFNVMESCVLSSLNSLTCGNCNRFDNTYCSNAVNDGLTPSQGIYYCKPQDCTYIPSEYTNSEDSTPRTYKNGETWCIYESKIGEGKEVPGSTNYLAQCDQGEIKINPCGTFGIRNELCIQEESTDYLSGNIFSKATCQPNPADTCYSFNRGETEEEKEDNLEKCSNQRVVLQKISYLVTIILFLIVYQNILKVLIFQEIQEQQILVHLLLLLYLKYLSILYKKMENVNVIQIANI
jgi:hypothetical protein